MSHVRTAPAEPKTITSSLKKYLDVHASYLSRSLETIQKNGGFIDHTAIFNAKKWKKLPNGTLYLEGCVLMYDGAAKIKLAGGWKFLYQPAFRFGDISPRAQLVTSEFTILLEDAAYTAFKDNQSPHRGEVTEINYL